MITRKSYKVTGTKFKWTKQAEFFAERGNFTEEEIKECEAWLEENVFLVGGGAILDWLNHKFNF